MIHLPEIGSKTGTRKPASVSCASEMRFRPSTEFFWYRFLVTNRTWSIFVPVYVVRVVGADFWYVCHVRKEVVEISEKSAFK